MKISLADAYLLSLSSVEFCEPKRDCWSRPSMAPCGSWSEQALDGLGIHVACIQNEVARRALRSPRGDKTPFTSYENISSSLFVMSANLMKFNIMRLSMKSY